MNGIRSDCLITYDGENKWGDSLFGKTQTLRKITTAHHSVETGEGSGWMKDADWDVTRARKHFSKTMLKYV